MPDRAANCLETAAFVAAAAAVWTVGSVRVVRFYLAKSRPVLFAAATVLVAALVVAGLVRPDRLVEQRAAQSVVRCPPVCGDLDRVLPVASGARIESATLFGEQRPLAAVSIVPVGAQSVPVPFVDGDAVALGAVPPGRYELHVLAQDASVASVTLLVE